MATQSYGAVPIIAVDGLTYRYPGANPETPPALDDITLRVAAGEYVVLLGHNGSGKSTLARHFNGLLLPTTGSVHIAGMATSEKRLLSAIRRIVGMVFHNPDNQIIGTIVEDDIAWSLANSGMPLATIRERVEEALDLVGLRKQRSIAPHLLSGGQKQRLAIAGVLALRPACIVADEVTALLDPATRREIVSVLYDLNRRLGLTIVQVTHLLEEVAEADRIVVLSAGRIVLTCIPSDLFARLDQLRQYALEIPDVLLLAQQLRRDGLPVSGNSVTPNALLAELLHD